jgi:hypothetical protein
VDPTEHGAQLVLLDTEVSLSKTWIQRIDRNINLTRDRSGSLETHFDNP